MIGALSQIADAVQQYRNAPFRSADWLANEVIAILESPGFVAHPTPPSADGAGVGDEGEVELRARAIAIVQAEARDLGYMEEDVAAFAEPDGDDLLAVQAVEAALRPSSDQPGGERYRHVKRGTVYEVIGTGELQMASEVVDGSAVVIYRGEGDGRLWVREEGEFYDGRFALLPGSGGR